MEARLRDLGLLNLYACIACPAGEEDPYLDWNGGCKFGRWYNMIWMEKIIGEHRPQQPPVRFPDA